MQGMHAAVQIGRFIKSDADTGNLGLQAAFPVLTYILRNVLHLFLGKYNYGGKEMQYKRILKMILKLRKGFAASAAE